jgi:hypothetical protein
MHKLTGEDILAGMRGEMDKAHTLLDTGDLLPWFAWCAVVADWTDLPTCFTSEGGFVTGVSYGVGNVRHNGLQYLRPSEIAKRDSEWDRASGGHMAQWILLLENEQEREYCLKAHQSFIEDGPPATQQELTENHARIMRMTRGLMGRIDANISQAQPVQRIESDDTRRLIETVARQRAEIELLRKPANTSALAQAFFEPSEATR